MPGFLQKAAPSTAGRRKDRKDKTMWLWAEALKLQARKVFPHNKCMFGYAFVSFFSFPLLSAANYKYL
jgi:hypothetical protein